MCTRAIIGNRMLTISMSMILLAHLCLADVDSSDLTQEDQTVTRRTDYFNATAPYCGVQAVCLAAGALGRDVDFSQMVHPRFIGSRQGSSLPELRLLCDELQLKTMVFSFLTVNSLYGATSPIILHTSSQGDSRNFDHWTLFTGIRDGKAMTWKVVGEQAIYEAIPLDELAVKWSGNALMVFSDHSSGIYFTVFVWAERLFLLALATLLIIALANINTVVRRRSNRTYICVGLLVMLVVSCLACLIHSRGLYSNSFLVNSDAIRKIQEDNIIGFLPTVSLARVESSLGDGNTLIIDARMEFQFRQGHIENSINIPFTMHLDEVEDVLKKYPKDTVIVVVYESFACARAIDVFRRIMRLGFNNIYRFEDGWGKWKEKHHDDD